MASGRLNSRSTNDVVAVRVALTNPRVVINLSGRTKDFAGCVFFDQQGRVLLVRQSYGKRLWNLPGGVVEDGEPAWEAMKRECREEIGVEVEGTLSGVYFLSHRNASGFVFRAAAIAGVPEPDHDEIDAIGYSDLEQLPSPVSSFTVQRIEDAYRSSPTVIMHVQHFSDYRVGDPKDVSPRD